MVDMFGLHVGLLELTIGGAGGVALAILLFRLVVRRLGGEPDDVGTRETLSGTFSVAEENDVEVVETTVDDGEAAPDGDDGLDIEQLVSYVLMVGGAGVTAYVMWFFWSNWGQPTAFPMEGRVPWIVFLMLTFSVAMGFAFIPLLAFTLGPFLPGLFTQPIANALFRVSMLPITDGVIEQQETDEYVVRKADAGLEPRSYWDRWAGTNIGITFVATREAFARLVATNEQRDELENLEYVDDGKTATIDMDRGGHQWYAHVEDQLADILVPIGRALAVLRDAAGPEVVTEAHSESLKEHGGDTSEFSNKAMIAGSFLFLLVGVLTGLIVFVT